MSIIVYLTLRPSRYFFFFYSFLNFSILQSIKPVNNPSDFSYLHSDFSSYKPITISETNEISQTH
jgi:hypothetical protein